MTTNVHRLMRHAAALIVMTALASTPAFAQTTADEPQRPARGSIKVSGYWNIDVLDADGTHVSHTEFENALKVEGGIVLAILLSGTVAVQTPFINLDGPTRPCGSASTWGCLIVPNKVEFTGTPTVPGLFTGQTFFPTLVVSAQTANSPKIVLTGLATMLSSGTIGKVQTGLSAGCPPAPAGCFLADSGIVINIFGGPTGPGVKLPFTEFTLPTPIAVQNGQVVSVTVTLSFSS